MEIPHVHHSWTEETDLLDPCLLVNGHPGLSMLDTEKEKLLTDGINQGVKLASTEHLLSVAETDYMDKIKEFHERLDMVKKIVKPGCSHEVLNTALCSLSSLARILSHMPQKLHASL